MPFAPPIVPQFKTHLHDPIFASILEQRSLAVVITGSALLHTGLTLAGLPGWQCPFRHQLGVPCLGCGLSRAIIALLHGNWQMSLTFHAFAPLFLVALGLIAGMVVLPLSLRCRIIQQVRIIEQRTGITAILLIGLVLYWLVRLTFFHASFIQLIMG